MSCYFLAQIKIRDKKLYQKYLERFDAVFAQYDGKVIAVDDRIKILEGAWHYTRMVIIRFPDRSEAERWYFSDAYQQLRLFRTQASDADIILVDGRD